MIHILTYEGCLELIRERLRAIGPGKLKKWCKTCKLTYPTIVGVKNGSNKEHYPHYLSHILEALGFECAVISTRYGQIVNFLYMCTETGTLAQGKEPFTINLLKEYASKLQDQRK